MDALFDRGQVVGEYSNAYWLIPCFHFVVDWRNESLVKILDGLELQLQIAIVACLVAGFHMDKHKVIVLEGINSCLRLAFVVGVGQTCGARYFDDAQTCIAANALNEVDSRNDSTALNLRILLHQRLHRRTVTATPRPDAVSLSFAFSGFGLIVGMLGQQFLGFQNQLVDEVGSLFGREMRGVSGRTTDHRTLWFHKQSAPLLVRMVMGWGTCDVLVATFDD